MATLQISCFGGQDNGVAIDPKSREALTTSGTNAKSAVLTGKYVKVQSDAAHIITMGPDATAVATATFGTYLGANEVLWLTVPGVALKIGAITA